VEVWQTSNFCPQGLGKERKKERRTNDRMKIYGLPYYIGWP